MIARFSSSASGMPGNASLTGLAVEAVIVSSRSRVARRAGADQQRRRAAERRQRHLPERGAAHQGRSRKLDRPQDVAGFELRPAPAGDEFGDRDLSRSAVGQPDDTDAAQRAGQRNHRPGRQGHADVAADGRRIPDLERRDESPAALADQRRGDPGRRQRQPVELRDGAGRTEAHAVVANLGRRPAQAGEIDQPRQMRLRLGKQPRPAGQPCITGLPARQGTPFARADHFGDSVQIHNSRSLYGGTCPCKF